MSQCYLCGTQWDDQNAPCEGCQNEWSFQETLKKVAQRQRFLFGSVKASPDLAPPPEARPKRNPKPKPKAQTFDDPPNQATNVADQDLLKRPEEPLEALALEEQTIVHSDSVKLDRPRQLLSKALLPRIYAHALDVFLCCLLNLGIYNLMIWLSGRDSEKVLQQSLVPIFFVLFSFTALYFWLFKVLFKTSLGALFIQWMKKKPPTSKP